MGSPWGYTPAAREKAARSVKARQSAHDAKVLPVIELLRSIWTCPKCHAVSTVEDAYADCSVCGVHAKTIRTAWPAIVRTLNDRGIQPPRTGGKWNISAVRRIAARNAIP